MAACQSRTSRPVTSCSQTLGASGSSGFSSFAQGGVSGVCPGSCTCQAFGLSRKKQHQSCRFLRACRSVQSATGFPRKLTQPQSPTSKYPLSKFSRCPTPREQTMSGLCHQRNLSACWRLSCLTTNEPRPRVICSFMPETLSWVDEGTQGHHSAL